MLCATCVFLPALCYPLFSLIKTVLRDSPSSPRSSTPHSSYRDINLMKRTVGKVLRSLKKVIINIKVSALKIINAALKHLIIYVNALCIFLDLIINHTTFYYVRLTLSKLLTPANV